MSNFDYTVSSRYNWCHSLFNNPRSVSTSK
jgi:hypothetical protein